ncbi:MAG: cytochrome c biogenesis CcdA family protein [Anaerolineae bacterium]|jgi:cytochrome c-type biogenesis protein
MLAVNVTVYAALVAGLVSFFSPCVLPVIPVYLGYMTGTVTTKGSLSHRLMTLRHAAAFVLGFAIAFVALGAAMGLAGRWLYPAMPYITRLIGVVLMAFGLQMLGVLRLPFLSGEWHVELGHTQQGLWRSLLMGLAFAVGWSPCVGPVLSGILVLAADTQTAAHGALLLGAYALGMGLPFLLAGLLAGELRRLLARKGQVLAMASKVGGLLVLAMGFLMAIGQFERVVNSLMLG